MNYKVKQLNNKNQFITKCDKKIFFQSYDSLIAVYDTEKESLILGLKWDFSNTTLKHLYIFIDEYCNTKILNLLRYAKSKKDYIKDLIKANAIAYDPSMQ